MVHDGGQVGHGRRVERERHMGCVRHMERDGQLEHDRLEHDGQHKGQRMGGQQLEMDDSQAQSSMLSFLSQKILQPSFLRLGLRQQRIEQRQSINKKHIKI